MSLKYESQELNTPQVKSIKTTFRKFYYRFNIFIIEVKDFNDD